MYVYSVPTSQPSHRPEFPTLHFYREARGLPLNLLIVSFSSLFSAAGSSCWERRWNKRSTWIIENIAQR